MKKKWRIRNTPNRLVLRKQRIVYTGFIAQEVEKTAKELGYDFSGVDAPQNASIPLWSSLCRICSAIGGSYARATTN